MHSIRFGRRQAAVAESRTAAMPEIPIHPARQQFEHRLQALKQRLILETASAVKLLEDALRAMFDFDDAAAASIKERDDVIDREEVAIEQECFRLLAMESPVARDFRTVTFVLKANADVERVGDHAASVAKTFRRMELSAPPQWPTSLVELGQRVPVLCHELLRAMQNEDTEAARRVIAEDETIDRLERQLFSETVEFMRTEPGSEALGMQIHRIGRELERVADLMTDIARDIIYLNTGEIVRHQRKERRLRD